MGAWGAYAGHSVHSWGAVVSIFVRRQTATRCVPDRDWGGPPGGGSPAVDVREIAAVIGRDLPLSTPRIRAGCRLVPGRSPFSAFVGRARAYDNHGSGGNSHMPKPQAACAVSEHGLTRDGDRRSAR